MSLTRKGELSLTTRGNSEVRGRWREGKVKARLVIDKFKLEGQDRGGRKGKNTYASLLKISCTALYQGKRVQKRRGANVGREARRGTAN